jgi:hypothetical protein
MGEFDDLVADLKQKRDELRLKIHLASKEAQDEWEELEEKMQEFSSRAELGKTSEVQARPQRHQGRLTPGFFPARQSTASRKPCAVFTVARRRHDRCARTAENVRPSRFTVVHRVL